METKIGKMSKAVPLLDDGSDGEVDFSINKGYAENYDKWRKKEEMMKLKALGEELSESSSSSEEEEEPVIEKDFLKTLSLIKSKDPVIYKDNVTFFKDEGIPKKPKEKKEKSMFMKNYETELLLKTEGKSSDEDEDDLPSKPNTRELAELAKSFKTAVDSDEDDEDGEGGLFAVKSKSKQEEEKEEEEHLKWLKGQKKEIDKETAKELSFLHKYWNETKLDEGEKFLKDYILNQRFLDSNADDIPSYDMMEAELQQEEETIAQQEQFEEKYNFRFEEPDPEFIKRYPRTIGDSLRREDNRRKAKREEREERKKKDKEQMREELKRLKALKRKEIEEKFFKLKEASGKDEINFDESDIESDFDPDKHDEKMKELFDDDYYAEEEEQKPEFLFDAEIDDEDWDHWTREEAKRKAAAEAADFEAKEESSASEDEQAVDRKAEFEQEMIDSTRTGRKKGKKKSLFAKLVSQPKPLYDPDGKSFQEYLDEYYNLDYEDVIGDLPVKFKYRKVIPNDFGLSTDEILAADDKELNRWCSVKKTCQYRKDEEEIYEVQAFQKKAQNTAIKEKILASVYAPPEENSAENSSKPKKKRRRKKKKSLNGVGSEQDNLQNESMDTEEVESKNMMKTGGAQVKNDAESKDETCQYRKDEEELSKVQAFQKKVQNTAIKEKKLACVYAPPEKNSAENSSKPKKKRRRKKKSLNGVGSEQDNLQNESMDTEEMESKNIMQTGGVQMKNDDESKDKPEKKKSRKKKKKSLNGMENEQCEVQNESMVEPESTNEPLSSVQKKKHHVSNEGDQDGLLNTSLDNASGPEVSYSSSKKKKTKKSLLIEDNVDISISPNKNIQQESDSTKKKQHKNMLSHGDANFDNSLEPGESVFEVEDRSSKKKKRKHSDINSFQQDEPAYGDSNEDNKDNHSPKKKKHKKNTDVNETFDKSSLQKTDKVTQKEFKAESEQQRVHSKKWKKNKNKRKPFKQEPTDKRLALSDSRLAAFGINPKKFKNKIIYSQK